MTAASKVASVTSVTGTLGRYRALGAARPTSGARYRAPVAEETVEDAVPEGIAVEPVTTWFADHVPGAVPPLSFDLIAGGHSNLTYRVDAADGGRFVLRRPPLGKVLATAHDMAREHRIIDALATTEVPVPPALGLCEDDAVNGAPFYVMDFVDGLIVRSVDAAEALDEPARARSGDALVNTLAAIHAVDLAAVGLDDLGRHEGYIERQLRRWHGQWADSGDTDLPVIGEVHDALAAAVPEQGPATLVHGDYRLDNCLLTPDGEVAAVLDWELCTLGDPLADLGLLMVYWNEADDGLPVAADAATTVPGFASRQEIADRYAAATGRDISRLGFYWAFGYWKLACIVAGVRARYAAGVMGGQGDSDAVETFGDTVRVLADAAASTLEREGTHP